MSSENDFRKQHEKFVVSETGSSAMECLLLISSYPLLAFLCSICIHLLLKLKNGFVIFLAEFLIMVVPLFLMIKLDAVYLSFFLLSLLAFVFLSLLCSLWNKKKNLVRIVFSLVTPVKSRSFITYFRSIVNLISVFCILAVDFPIFPRKYAKTESFGFSLMDIGLGFFIVANGIITKTHRSESIIKTIKSTLPIIALGVFRCISVKALDYQEVVTEYGTHWNFFFTLAAVKLIGSFLIYILPNRVLLTSIIVAGLHHFILQFGIQSWIMNDPPRNNPFSANREGLASLLGHLSLFLASVAIGKRLNREEIDLVKDQRNAFKGFLTALILFFITYYYNINFPLSRRFANVSYILWILSLSILLLSICLINEISLRVILFVRNVTINENIVPITLDSINYNGLLFFLLGNILTGFVNIWIQTINVEMLHSYLILLTYMFLICFTSIIFYRNRIKFAL